MEIFNFSDAWEFLKEGTIIKRASWKNEEFIAMLFPDGSKKLYKLVNWVPTLEDREATDWTFSKEE